MTMDPAIECSSIPWRSGSMPLPSTMSLRLRYSKKPSTFRQILLWLCRKYPE